MRQSGKSSQTFSYFFLLAVSCVGIFPEPPEDVKSLHEFYMCAVLYRRLLDGCCFCCVSIVICFYSNEERGGQGSLGCGIRNLFPSLPTASTIASVYRHTNEAGQTLTIIKICAQGTRRRHLLPHHYNPAWRMNE